jgi:hypothetical protein
MLVVGEKFFSPPKCPHRIWDPTTLLYNGTEMLSEVNRVGPEFNHSLPSSSKVMCEWSHISTHETHNTPYGQDFKAVVHAVTTAV